MLYVFHVDVGRMMSFDMTVALSSVENLKDTIERLHGIPAANIVLLVSGGEMLTQSTQVSYYSAGTDTNPIYMFLTGDARPSATAVQSEPDLDLREQVERSMELPVCYDTVEKRAKLAFRMHELARDEERTCERLVHEQHLQQQGWSAVVANMEDLTNDFRLRFRDFCLSFDRHLEKRDKYLELLRSFSEDLSKLERIPILPGLMPLAEADFHGFDKLLENDDVFSNTQQESVLLAPGANIAVIQETNSETIKPENSDGKEDEKSMSSTAPHKKAKIANEEESSTANVAGRSGSTNSINSTSSTRRQNSLNLLQWITSKENHNALKLMSDECIQGLSTFNEEIYRKLKMEVDNIIKLAEQTDVKEIKGLGDRLCKLEELKYKIKSMVKDQKELSTALQQNQNRAMNLGDTSVLPDLCASHQSQLMVMLQNHLKIREHRRIIAKAKDELGQNLHFRLKRIVLIENAMSEFDNRLLFNHRCLRRAERHICIIEQIHQAPCIYVAAVTEVVRRRIFSGEFREWASKLSEDFAAIHSEEIKRRQLFNASFEGHFLNILFPGMHDMPPAFANDNSLVFDTGLPNLTRSDIDTLTSQLPDLATQIQLPDMDSVINFFVSRSGTCDEELLKQHVANVLNIDLSQDKSPQLQHQRVSDLQKSAAASGGATKTSIGCEESETDTETEFEQLSAATAMQSTDQAGCNCASVGTSTTAAAETMARSTATEPLLTQIAATLTEETNTGAIAELDRMRPLLAALHKLAMDCLQMARNTLGDLRADAEHSRSDLQADLSTLNEKWLQMQRQFQENEYRLQQAAGEKSNELESLRKALTERDAQLATLKAQLEEMDAQRIKCATMETQIEELRDKLKAASDETNAAVAEAREELIHEHKTEIESLRCRFKLMTSMERSPSDSSLEKIERPTSSGEIVGGASASNAIDLAQHEALLAEQRAAFEAEKESAVNAAVELERSLWQSKILPKNSESVMATNANILKDMLEEKERQLEQLREKDLIVTKENFQLKTRLDALTNDDGTSWMHEKIEILKQVKERLEAELASERAKRNEMETSFAATSRSTSSQKYIVLESCSKGDIVFVVWSIRHGQFMVVQDSQSLYFVHGDSLAALNLRLPFQQADGMGPDEVPIPMPYYAIGRVIEKEYCQARKDENRYRVQRGSKFYRIKLEPLTTRISLRRDRLSSYSTSRSISQCESQTDNAPILQATPPQQQQTAARAKVGSASSAANIKTSAVTPSRDAVDASTITLDVGQSVITTTTTNSGQISLTHFKDRTISISSVNEEDDEPLSSIRSEQRYRYTSVSEEDELPAETGAAAAPTPPNTANATTVATTALQQHILPETVITEQPTARTTKELQMQLMLASVDIKPIETQQQQQQKQYQTQKQDNTITTTTTTKEVTANICDEAETELANEAENITAIAEAVAAAAAVLAVTEAEAAEQAKKAQEVAVPATETTPESSLQIVSSTTPISIISSNYENKLAATTKTSSPLAASCNFASNSDLLMIDAAACTSTSLPQTSIATTTTTSEDSDEFRSLEGRDDTDFPISE